MQVHHLEALQVDNHWSHTTHCSHPDHHCSGIFCPCKSRDNVVNLVRTLRQVSGLVAGYHEWTKDSGCGLIIDRVYLTYVLN